MTFFNKRSCNTSGIDFYILFQNHSTDLKKIDCHNSSSRKKIEHQYTPISLYGEKGERLNEPLRGWRRLLKITTDVQY